MEDSLSSGYSSQTSTGNGYDNNVNNAKNSKRKEETSKSSLSVPEIKILEGGIYDRIYKYDDEGERGGRTNQNLSKNVNKNGSSRPLPPLPDEPNYSKIKQRRRPWLRICLAAFFLVLIIVGTITIYIWASCYRDWLCSKNDRISIDPGHPCDAQAFSNYSNYWNSTCTLDLYNPTALLLQSEGAESTRYNLGNGNFNVTIKGMVITLSRQSESLSVDIEIEEVNCSTVGTHLVTLTNGTHNETYRVNVKVNQSFLYKDPEMSVYSLTSTPGNADDNDHLKCFELPASDWRGRRYSFVGCSYGTLIANRRYDVSTNFQESFLYKDPEMSVYSLTSTPGNADDNDHLKCFELPASDWRGRRYSFVGCSYGTLIANRRYDVSTNFQATTQQCPCTLEFNAGKPGYIECVTLPSVNVSVMFHGATSEVVLTENMNIGEIMTNGSIQTDGLPGIKLKARTTSSGALFSLELTTVKCEHEGTYVIVLGNTTYETVFTVKSYPRTPVIGIDHDELGGLVQSYYGEVRCEAFVGCGQAPTLYKKVLDRYEPVPENNLRSTNNTGNDGVTFYEAEVFEKVIPNDNGTEYMCNFTYNGRSYQSETYTALVVPEDYCNIAGIATNCNGRHPYDCTKFITCTTRAWERYCGGNLHFYFKEKDDTCQGHCGYPKIANCPL